MKKPLFISAVLIVLLGVGILYALNKNSTTQEPTSKTPTVSPTAPSPGKNTYDLDVVVNKKRPLPDKQYAPSDLIEPNLPVRVPGNESMQVRKILLPDLTAMFASAKKDGIELKISSAYRSYQYQVSLYNQWVQKSGKTEADRASARPGYSEHQTGLALDIEPIDNSCEVEQCFAQTKAGIWLAGHAHEYGFIIRYPKDQEAVTGYKYEPWHIRYLGRELAVSFTNSGKKTLEEYYGLPNADNYN